MISIYFIYYLDLSYLNIIFYFLFNSISIINNIRIWNSNNLTVSALRGCFFGLFFLTRWGGLALFGAYLMAYAHAGVWLRMSKFMMILLGNIIKVVGALFKRDWRTFLHHYITFQILIIIESGIITRIISLRRLRIHQSWYSLLILFLLEAAVSFISLRSLPC